MATTLKTTSDETRLYEIALLLPGDSTDKEKNDTLKSVEELLKERGMKVQEQDIWDRMGLAYKIKGQTHGRYILYYVEGSPAEVRALDHALRIERGVLRHMVLSVPEGYQVQDWKAQYDAWKQEKSEVELQKSKEREEKLKKQIVQRAARKDKKAEGVQAAPKATAKEEVSKEELSEKLSNILSEEDLNL